MIPMTTIRGWGPLPDLVREMAGDCTLGRILSSQGLPASLMHMPERQIPLAKMVRVFETSAKMLGEEEFGATVGEKCTPEHYGEWAAYAYSAMTLREGLTRVCRTLWSHWPAPLKVVRFES